MEVYAMLRISFVLACIANAGYGRRLQMPTDKMKSAPSTKTIESRFEESASLNGLSAFATLLLAQRPSDAFNSPVGLSSLKRTRPGTQRAARIIAQVPVEEAPAAEEESEALVRPAEKSFAEIAREKALKIRSNAEEQGRHAQEPGQQDLDEDLRAKLRALDPEKEEEEDKSVKKEVDLNGINPLQCLGNSVLYAFMANFLFQLCGTFYQWAEIPPNLGTNSVILTRIQTFTIQVMLGTTGLGSSTLAIASIGQVFLAGIIAWGISQGKYDPNKKRVDPYMDRKMDKYKKFFSQMMGDWSKYDYLRKD